MMSKHVPTRLEELAGEFFLDTSDPDEPIDALIDRVRWEIGEAQSEADNHFQDCLDQLDRIEADLPDDEDAEAADTAAVENTNREQRA